MATAEPMLTPVPGPGPSAEVERARARLAETVALVSALDAEVEARSAALASFAAELERRLGPPDTRARRAAGVVRRIQALAAALAAEQERVRLGPRAPSPRRARAAAARRVAPHAGARGVDERTEADPVPDEPAEAPEEPAPRSAAEALRRVYRRLARLLHPDLAADDADRGRLTTLMAQVNAAYAARDLQALELTAEKLGAGEAPGLVTDDERLADLARRQLQLERVADSLRRAQQRLEQSDTARLRAEADRRAAAGGDYFKESEAELEAEAAAALADALARLEGLQAAAQALAQARSDVMADIERTGALAFDPLAESEVVRRSATRLERSQAGAAARALARWLEEAAGARPWEAALTLLAFFAEAGGERPPPSLATGAGMAERWDALRGAWPGAPDLPAALLGLPPHLVVGARAGQEAVQAGLQLAAAELTPGVHLALSHPQVAELARTVLAALGPAARCTACQAEVRAVHVLATRGLDERHALLCPLCGAALQRYWRFGAVEGLEALAPLSLQLGLTAEVAVHLGSATLGFGLLPAERDALTAKGLLERFTALYLEPCGVELPAGALAVRAGSRTLEGRAKLAAAGRLALAATRTADTTAEALLELLRTRVERRFRPGP
jgi:hypothetical protein